jgi:hypothetical protein
MGTDVINSISNSYQIIALLIISISYIISLLYNKNQNKNQNEILINKFEEQNEKLIRKLDELKETRNSLDLQSSMDLIELIFTKSMTKISENVKLLLEENNIKDDKRKPIIFTKVKNLIDMEFDENIIILGRIYYKNVRLSYYISELDRNEMINTVCHKLDTTNYNFHDLVDYINHKFKHIRQLAQLQISK